MTNKDFDQERYTTAMLALGFAYGLLRRVTQRIPKALARELELESDMAWLKERVERVMQLNDEVQKP